MMMMLTTCANIDWYLIRPETRLCPVIGASPWLSFSLSVCLEPVPLPFVHRIRVLVLPLPISSETMLAKHRSRSPPHFQLVQNNAHSSASIQWTGPIVSLSLSLCIYSILHTRCFFFRLWRRKNQLFKWNQRTRIEDQSKNLFLCVCVCVNVWISSRFSLSLVSFFCSFWCYQLFVSSRAILLSIVFKHQQPINKTGRRRMISFVDDFSILLLLLLLSWIDRHLPLYLFSLCSFHLSCLFSSREFVRRTSHVRFSLCNCVRTTITSLDVEE